MSEQDALNSKNKNNVIQNSNIVNIDNDRRRKNENMDINNSPKRFKNNYYSVLDCEKDEECDREILNKFENHVKQVKENNNKEKPQHSHSATTSTNNNTSNVTTDNTVVSTEKGKNKKIPPINIVDIDTKQLIEFIKNGLKINDFKIKEFRDKKSLYTNNLPDFLRVKAFLEKTQAKFYTFTPKDMKIKTYLLKGLDANIDTDEILFELLKFESDELKFIKVSPFSTKLSVEKGVKLPMFLVQISPESNLNKLKKTITTLRHCIITWEQVRRPEIPQCRNCQGFFHSAANCYLPRRCVKCNMDHARGKCTTETVPANEKNKLFCVLCNKYGHPASYKGCEKYKQLKQKISIKRKEKLETKAYNTSTFTNPGLSYANVIRGNNTLNTDTNKTDNLINNPFLQEIKNFMININNQIMNFQKQLNLQVSRIDTIFSMLEG